MFGLNVMWQQVAFPMDISGKQKVKLEAEIRVGGEKKSTHKNATVLLVAL